MADHQRWFASPSRGTGSKSNLARCDLFLGIVGISRQPARRRRDARCKRRKKASRRCEIRGCADVETNKARNGRSSAEADRDQKTLGRFRAVLICPHWPRIQFAGPYHDAHRCSSHFYSAARGLFRERQSRRHCSRLGKHATALAGAIHCAQEPFGRWCCACGRNARQTCGRAATGSQEADSESCRRVSFRLDRTAQARAVLNRSQPRHCLAVALLARPRRPSAMVSIIALVPAGSPWRCASPLGSL